MMIKDFPESLLELKEIHLVSLITIKRRDVLYVSISMQLPDSFMEGRITGYFTDTFGILTKKRKRIRIPVFNP